VPVAEVAAAEMGAAEAEAKTGRNRTWLNGKRPVCGNGRGLSLLMRKRN
jgi:hypothetical protein